MGYTNSSLVSFTQLSPNHSGQRTQIIDRITPHCYVGQVSVERMGKGWSTPDNVSANYGIGYDGRIGLYVEEKNRAWTSSSGSNDQRAITIECASDSTHPYGMNGNVYHSLIDLCADICKRNGKSKLLWISDKDEALNYKPKQDEMIITVHRWFASKECPGDWLYSRLDDLADKVTAKLNGLSAEMQETAKDNTVRYHVKIGTFNNKEDADAIMAKLKNAGFDAIIETQTMQDLNANFFNIGDAVKLQKGALHYGTTKEFKSWVYDTILYVREIKGTRFVVSTQKSGDITGAVDKKYLIKI